MRACSSDSCGGYRKLLIDEVRDPGFTRLRHQRLAERLERFALMGIEQPERNAARSGFSGGHDDFGAADRERQRTQGRAFDKAASADVCHRHLLPERF